MTPRMPKIVAGSLAAMAIAAAVGGAAFAQTATPTPTARATPVSPQQRAQELLNALASKLGKTPTELQTALVAVQKDRVAAALAAGRITAAQATAMNQRIDQNNGVGLFFGGPGPGGFEHGKGGFGPGGPGFGMPDPSALATFLGVSTTDLRTALRSGKSLAQVAQDKGKSRDDLKAFLTNQEKTRLAQAVTAGKLTQAQADQRLTGFTSRLDQIVDRTGPPPGRRPGRGGPFGGFRANDLGPSDEGVGFGLRGDPASRA